MYLYFYMHSQSGKCVFCLTYLLPSCYTLYNYGHGRPNWVYGRPLWGCGRLLWGCGRLFVLCFTHRPQSNKEIGFIIMVWWHGTWKRVDTLVITSIYPLIWCQKPLGLYIFYFTKQPLAQLCLLFLDISSINSYYICIYIYYIYIYIFWLLLPHSCGE